MKLELYDEVELIAEIDDESVEVGDRGVVCELLNNNGVAVEFFDDDNTIAVAFLDASKVRKVQSSNRVETKS